MFFPNGGRYDLGLKGVEAISTTSDFYEYYGNRPDTGFSGDLVDVGEVVAPRAGVSNLSFREFLFDQSIEWKYRLPARIEIVRDANGLRVKGSVTNDTPYRLDSVKLWIEGRQVTVAFLDPGATVEIDSPLASDPSTVRAPGSPPPAKGLVTLTAQVKGIPAGTSLGEEKGLGATLVYSYGSISAVRS
jgi:hypothetical protein